MISKLKTILLLLILGLAFILPAQAFAIPDNLQQQDMEKNVISSTDTNIISLAETKEVQNPLVEQVFEPAIIVAPQQLINGSWYYGGAISAGQKHYYVLEDVPWNSAKYRAGCWEVNPGAVNLDIYVKFGAIPTTTDYDYKASTGNQYEYVDIEIPEDDDYGDMYIMVYCVSGSDFEWTIAWYVNDYNGCWRTADYLTTPTNGQPAIHISQSVDDTDLNDFYKFFLYSGQEFYIDAEATSGWGLYGYFYDSDHNLIASDTSGIWIDITHFITAFDSDYYYVRFYSHGGGKQDYVSDFTDENADLNNRYGDAFLLSPEVGYTGSMHSSDVNDYYYFMVDSGEHITISITLDDPLSDPYYDAFLYTEGSPYGEYYVKYDNLGTSLDITYYCGEYYTQEVQPGTRNKIYLRLWNAALHYGRPDVTSGYTITVTRSWDVNNDRMTTAQSYTIWGPNNTTPKLDDLDGENDVNDWFKITTKAGYTIKIAVNETGNVPSPFLDGYLLDNTGTIVAADASNNITITYTAMYNGDYYFRLYEAAAQYWYGAYVGPSPYYWFIYTSAYDGNDNFTTAEYVEPPVTIDSTVSSADMDDYYQFEVPSGYEISLTGTCAPGDLVLYLYDQSETEIDSDNSSPWAITHQHKGIDTETYYARVYNGPGYVAATYSLTITLTKIDPDGDGELLDATYVPVVTGGNETGSDNIGGIDINDYYAFDAQSGDAILIAIDGPTDLVARLVKDDGLGGEIVLVEEIASSLVVLEYFPNDFYPGDTYYLRICAPGGVPAGPYDWNITLLEYDTNDGYWGYANELASGQHVVINGELSETDTNDWYHFVLRSGEKVDVDLTSTMPDPHVGFYINAAFYVEVLDDGQILHTNYTHLFWLESHVYIQVVNEAAVAGDYTLELTFTLIDNDNNGAPEIAEPLPLEADLVDELSIDDINDFYETEIRSGYNLTVKYNAVGFEGLPIFVYLYDDHGVIIANSIGTAGVLTYTNPLLDPIIGYVQFYNLAPFIGFNATQSYGEYAWNATLINDDPDGDFDKATTLTGPVEIVNDQMFANLTWPSYNLSDINDFYKIDLGLGDVLSLSISITGVLDPWFEVYIYDWNFNVVASAIGADAYELLFNVGDAAGTYYIRFYNAALDAGDYTMALSIYTDTDSYFGGATPITPGHQTPDSLSDIDIADFYSIHLEPGWRIKVNATVIGMAVPDVDLLAFDPDQLAVIADLVGVGYLEIEFTAEKSGTYYIEFYNTGGTVVDYDWWVTVYEDENGVFATATNIASGEHQDNVQELDKFDYFAFTGNAGEAFIITCSLPAGLDLELYLYNSTEGFIDADTTGPGLALTYTPATTGAFYILFANPTGDTGDYSFTLSGAGTPPGPTPTPTTTPTTNFFMQKFLGLPVWLWFVIVGGGLVLIIVIIVVVVAVVGKKKKGSVR